MQKIFLKSAIGFFYNKINNNEYLEFKKILNNKKIEITKKTEHIEDDYVDKDKANKNKKDDKGLEI